MSQNILGTVNKAFENTYTTLMDWNEEMHDPHLIVETTNGKIKGSKMKMSDIDKEFYAFQSIPYAEPPIGKLRFQNPQSKSNWTGVLDATSPPKACYQPIIYFTFSEMSEDCLFLNVLTPTLTPSILLPVIFWIYGGFFIYGDGKIEDYDPEFLVDEDVIMITINYRLGIFGYLSTGDHTLSGNYGIKDQIMALKWVQENIVKFGGDPRRITIMGQSAGAANVALLLQSPMAQGLFSAAIMDSGNSLNLWSRNEDPDKFAKSIANFFKIAYNTSHQLKTKLQEINSIQLVLGTTFVYLKNAALSNPVNGLPFAPTVEPGVIDKMNYENLKSGKFNKVPVLTGFNSNEGIAFVDVFDYFPAYLILYDISPSRFVPTDLNINKTLLHKVGKMIKQFYFGSKSVAASKEKFTEFVTDHEFVIPAIEFVRLVSNYTDTYFYEFSYEGQIPVENREVPGVDHGEELYYIFKIPNSRPASDDDLITRKRLVRLWTNFAKYHNPTPNADPLLQNITWKSVEPTRINYLNINKTLHLHKNPHEKSDKFWKNIYDTYGVPPFDTY